MEHRRSVSHSFVSRQQQPAPTPRGAPLSQNGVSRSRSNSETRRDSHFPEPTKKVNFPPAQVPPVSYNYKDPYGAAYQDEYSPTTVHRAVSSSRPRPSTGRDPPTLRISTNNTLTVPPLSPISPLSPILPVDPASTSAKRSGSRKSASVPDRSPLQKLEVKLDDISKEEKRARLQDAEMAAQERAAALARARGSSQGHSRNVSMPANYQRATAGSRNGKAPVYDHNRASQDDPYQDPKMLSERDDDYNASGSRGYRRSHLDGVMKARHNRSASGAVGGMVAGRSGGSFRDRDAQSRSIPAFPSPPARGLGLSGVEGQSYNQARPSTDIGRHDSRRLSKRSPQKPTFETRDALADAAAQYRQPVPSPESESARHSIGTNKYELSPLASEGGRQRREQTAFSPQGSVSSTGHHRHFHRGKAQERRYQRPKYLEEWRGAGIARLSGLDLDLDIPNEPEGPPKAWWEKGRRRSGGYPSGTSQHATEYDGGHEERSSQTFFNPPLYLKCGPLLRFTGIKQERNNEIWRGSVMIVTIDSGSKYEPAPALRLFKQPVDLLPPPPQIIDMEGGQKLDPAYVDPVAGQIKVSRTGRTLYVKPVEELEEEVDLSRIEDDSGLFEEIRTAPYLEGRAGEPRKKDGEKLGKFRQVSGTRLHSEQGVTFWRFNLEVELGTQQARIAYRINRGPAIGFWVPARGETMNIMFYSCNGFSLSVDSDEFCGPDPMWRDVLNNHQTRPFHVMIGGGDQIYNDAAMRQTKYFQEWTMLKNPAHKHSAQFSVEMQQELEEFYLDRYSMWFSQGLYGMAAGQIPMVNIWDDHDIIDGFGSYPHHFMSTAVFTGLGGVAFKYYMLFQHQSLPTETTREEPSWLLGASPGPYINELSRNLFMFMGKKVAFLGLDCRTERMRDLILSAETYDIVFDRCRQEIVKGETQHLIVLLGVPIAYPRLNFLENILTSRVMDPIKALGRTGLLGNFVNKFDGGVEILDDLDDHWTAKHHKGERNWFIQELQEIAAEKSVRVTILGGDVHLAAVGEFISNKKLGIPKDQDHRYMPNVISSAIVNTPPPDMMADVLNKRNKIHHLDEDTDEDMIPMFPHDVDGKPRNNKRLLPRRNWCAIREYLPSDTPPDTPSRSPSPAYDDNNISDYPAPLQPRRRSLSERIPGIGRRLSKSERSHPPVTFATQNYNKFFPSSRRSSSDYSQQDRRPSGADISPSRRNSYSRAPSDNSSRRSSLHSPSRPNTFHRRPTGLSDRSSRSAKSALNDPRGGHINLENGLDVVLNVEVSQKDPAGITSPYRLLIPALDYQGDGDENPSEYPERGGFIKNLIGRARRRSVASSTEPSIQESRRSSFRRQSISRPPTEQRDEPPVAPAVQPVAAAPPFARELREARDPRHRYSHVPPAPPRAKRDLPPVMGATYMPGKDNDFGFNNNQPLEDESETEDEDIPGDFSPEPERRRKNWKFWTG